MSQQQFICKNGNGVGIGVGLSGTAQETHSSFVIFSQSSNFPIPSVYQCPYTPYHSQLQTGGIGGIQE